MKDLDKVEKLQFLNFDFTGVLNEQITQSVSIDKGYNRIIGIGVLSDFYREPSTIEIMSFDSQIGTFQEGLMSSYFQSFDTDFIPVDISNMELKEVRVTLKDYLGTARKVQIYLILSQK